MTTTLQSEAYLRVVGNGFNYTGYVSENGTEWTVVGTHTASFVPQKVGLIVSNGGQPVSEIPAKFDFFVVEYSPPRVFLPILIR
jgi:hypothetical protein